MTDTTLREHLTALLCRDPKGKRKLLWNDDIRHVLVLHDAYTAAQEDGQAGLMDEPIAHPACNAVAEVAGALLDEKNFSAVPEACRLVGLDRGSFLDVLHILAQGSRQ